jgi:CTP:molybdopterin cytidylyltransferase MocA
MATQLRLCDRLLQDHLACYRQMTLVSGPRQVGKTTTCRMEGKPWFLVEVKTRDTALADSLGYFQKAIKAKHAFQAVIDLPYVQADCFARTDPTVVPARTLLSQLL